MPLLLFTDLFGISNPDQLASDDDLCGSCQLGIEQVLIGTGQSIQIWSVLIAIWQSRLLGGR